MRSPEAAPASGHAGAGGADGERIAARLEALWRVAQAAGGGADRPAYSAAEAAAMRLVAGWAQEAGLEPALDPHGNLWALPKDAGDTALVTSGSHVDTVPGGGRYDGALGTVLAVEAAEALAAGGRARAAGTAGGDARFGLLVCAAEEASRFGAGTVGSRLLAGLLGEQALAGLHDGAGVSALEARGRYLAELGDLPRRRAPSLERLRAHVEVHVEQRHELGPAGADLGLVERIAAPHRHELVVEGAAGHAGEVSMEARRDALCAAAELVLALEAAAREEAASGREQAGPTVATAGRIVAEPGAVSVIPARVTLVVEVRGTAADSIGRVEDAFYAACVDVERRRGVVVRRSARPAGDPVELDAALLDAAERAAARRGLRALRTHSGAGHDVQHLAAAGVPAALLFVPLAGGESHTPAEDARPDHVLAAGRVLIDVLGETAAR